MQLSAFEEQLLQRVVEVALRDDERPILLGRRQGGLPQQLADEGGAHAARAHDEMIQVGDVEAEPLAVELEQAETAPVVGKRDLDREINPAGPSRKRGLEEIRAVRRQQEDDVGVLLHPVELIEQLEEQ